MKKLAGIVLLAGFAGVLLPISNSIFFHGTPFSNFTLTDPDAMALKPVLEKKCLSCHSAQARVPYYAAFPVARDIIQKDITSGTRSINLDQALSPQDGKRVDEVTLAKMEWIAEDGSMPPFKYLALHWDSALSSHENALIKKWARDLRLKYYATPGTAPEFAGEVLQPLPLNVPVNDAKAKLGNKLFHDTRLSGDNTVSCATCHGLDTAGVDGGKTSTGIRGQLGPINDPTVYNAVFNFKQFWDGRAADLKEQAAGPVTNPLEMDAQWPDVIAKLQQDEALVNEFNQAYPQGLSEDSITDAIAEFEKTLVTPNSRFDRYLRGEKNVLSAREIEGYGLFRKYGCVSCHVGKALGGQSFEKMGVTRDYFKDRGGLTEADNGRFNVTKNEDDRHKFKVPTLRNIALTGPYFHDGATDDLRQAVKTMIRYQTEEKASENDVDRITEFLETLTGEYQGSLLTKKEKTK